MKRSKSDRLKASSHKDPVDITSKCAQPQNIYIYIWTILQAEYYDGIYDYWVKFRSEPSFNLKSKNLTEKQLLYLIFSRP